MDEETLQQQYEQTGNLLDVLKDSATLEAVMQIEAECGDIGAGFPAYSTRSNPVTPAQSSSVLRTVRLQSIVLTTFTELIQTVNLGGGTEAAIAEGRRRIRQHLAALTDEQQAYFDALVDEDQQQPNDKPVRAQLKSVIYSLLSDVDWQAIGQAATEAIQTQWIEFTQASKTA
ncbi:hypothetical protein NDI45_28085 [Leptolyngbya sp. GB1-A1]|uniref:hypothetical protein n=1 Tax=Leptolyngbya sp. GB1-A1 TaxID=2933908 RepID=UPI00329904FE